ncbi:hypothetical protein [Fluviicola sp.]|uniref:hypothetical protein n=1 Tax=Fluviicola sp. TaxID=1917219 RepID=UPI003D2CF150
MRIFGLLVMTLLSFNAISQEDHFRILLGANLGSVRMENNQILTPLESYYNQSWNEDYVIHNTNYGTVTNKYKCYTAMGHVGVSVPFLKIKRISFGVEPKLGIGTLRSTEYIDKNNLNAQKAVKSFAMDATGLLYVRCRLGEEFHISLLGGYRFVWTYYNYQTPVFGLEFGIDELRIGVYGYLTSFHYDRQLSNGQKQPVESYSELGSISLYYCLGKKWFDK